YSSQGVSVATGSQTATVVVVPVTPGGSEISALAVAAVSVQLLAPGSASVGVSPVDLTANGNTNQSAITITGLLGSDGVTPVPDGALVGLTSVPFTAIYNGAYLTGAGGTISSAGTSPGDGTPASNTSNVLRFTMAGGKVNASYSDLGISANPGQTEQAYVAVVPLNSSGSVLSSTAIGVGSFYLHVVTLTPVNGSSTFCSN